MVGFRYMMRRSTMLVSLLSICLLIGCVKRIYRLNDFRLHHENYRLSQNALLRTDGVYVLDSIYSGAGSRVAENHQFYVFYKSGQVNLTLDPGHSINRPEEYLKSIQNHLQKSQDQKMKTLFEGYYKIDYNKLVIERASVPRNLMVYSYGILLPKSLEIRTSTINGKGHFNDKYFQSNYREVYRFIQLPELSTISLTPGW